ncbi:PilN domain-containing protein [Nitrospirillum viridazoti]|uniref:General secretion pathway protein L n=1 Tax=Nitrospirillum amazonense TaxID=28077 RepID=A0A560HUZ3_9PROT|nr:PilN domain-containing protein [Nitrospirillum amazonense]TWB48954.1 hypothetical protein FBZ92_12756 [Nitrospirillum amazonense]
MRQRRLLAATANLVDGMADAFAMTLPQRVVRYLGLSAPRVQLRPGAMGVVMPAGAGPVTLVLDSEDVYTVDLPLPPGVGVDPWKQAAMMAHRYMPLKPELLAWDLVTVRQEGQLIARVSMVRRTVLAAALHVSGRVAAVTTDGVGPQPQFLRLDIGRLRRRMGRMLVLLIAAAFALPAPPLLVAWTLDQQTAHMEQKLKTLSDDVKAARQLRDRADWQGNVLGRSAAALVQPPRRQVLDEIARALPDDAWLQDLVLGPDGMVLQIYGADPHAVLARFQAVPLFTNVRLTTEPEPGSATFSLALSIATGAPSRSGTAGNAKEGGGQ